MRFENLKLVQPAQLIGFAHAIDWGGDRLRHQSRRDPRTQQRDHLFFVNGTACRRSTTICW
jgi:hypothetical protein